MTYKTYRNLKEEAIRLNSRLFYLDEKKELSKLLFQLRQIPTSVIFLWEKYPPLQEIDHRVIHFVINPNREDSIYITFLANPQKQIDTVKKILRGPSF